MGTPNLSMDDIRSTVYKADKFTQKKDYICLLPGCHKKAIRSHAIQRSVCISALADDRGAIYTQPQNHHGMMSPTVLTDPPRVAKVGVNNASTFKGFCSEHDTRLFASAETTNPNRRNGMCISLHMRALSLEYCRKRTSLDFFRKISELTNNSSWRQTALDQAKILEQHLFVYKTLYLDSIFNLIRGIPVDGVEYFCAPFSRNLQVSCCGVFNEAPEAFESAISFNLISYADMSVLVLTIFKTFEKYLNSYIGKYQAAEDAERLLNDIAFSKCEEPLISPKLWDSLDSDVQLQVKLSLRPPFARIGAPIPRIIKIKPTDLVVEITPAMWTRLSPKMYANKSSDGLKK